jgi:hypothetical protein
MTAAHIQVPFSPKWEVGVNPSNYANRRTGAEPWIGELTCRPSFDREVMERHDDWRDAARHAAAVFWQSYGFLVGESPRVADEVEEVGPGRVGVRVTALVTVPPFWTGAPETLGQQSLWETA